MIIVSRTITVKRQTASLNEPLYLFKGDGDIVLLLDLVNIVKKIKYGKIDKNNIITEDFLYGTACIYKPDNSLAFTTKAKIIDGQLQVILAKNLMDDSVEVGEHKLQIHLYDADDNRLTIPEVNKIFISKPLCDDSESIPIVAAQVGISKVGYSIVG